MLKNLLRKKIILASGSPRRQFLLKDLGLNIEIKTKNIEEIYPDNLKGKEIAIFLAELKANAFDTSEIPENSLLVTADTIVCLDDEVLQKPKDFEDAQRILRSLSGKEHEVISGVCIRSKTKMRSFYASTKVCFKELSKEEIDHYIQTYQPYDKAGAYGIQEWIGYVAIEKIEGSFYNVMGLPIQKLYEELLMF